MTEFKELRESAGYKTQAALAEKLGTNNINVTRWEKGQRYPRPKMLVTLEKELGVSVGEIIAAITAAKEKAPQSGTAERTNDYASYFDLESSKY